MQSACYSPRIRVTPTISATPDYSDNDVIGGIQTVGAQTGQRPFGEALTGILKSITIKDKADQKPGLKLFIFDQLPTGTYTDNAAFAWGAADFAKCIHQVVIAASDWKSEDGKAIVCVDLSVVIGCRDSGAHGGNNAFHVVATVDGSTPNYAAVDDLEFQYGVLQD